MNIYLNERRMNNVCMYCNSKHLRWKLIFEGYILELCKSTSHEVNTIEVYPSEIYLVGTQFGGSTVSGYKN
jgi:hypothetical protein